MSNADRRIGGDVLLIAVLPVEVENGFDGPEVAGFVWASGCIFVVVEENSCSPAVVTAVRPEVPARLQRGLRWSAVFLTGDASTLWRRTASGPCLSEGFHGFWSSMARSMLRTQFEPHADRFVRRNCSNQVLDQSASPYLRLTPRKHRFSVRALVIRGFATTKFFAHPVSQDLAAESAA